MCGIAGLVMGVADPRAPAVVASMTRVLRHRGPDGQGFVAIDPHTGASSFAPDAPPFPAPLLFGHRRLSIIDLSEAGRQPMGLPDAPHWITFNGEIYNYVELREELAPEFSFQTRSDTEVILRAWQKWGTGALTRLRGMFAFALWDGHQLYLARDRMGIKPLYYLALPDRLLFASEIKAFVQGAGERLEIEPLAVAEYFTFQNLFLSRSFFKNVALLEPGHYLTVAVPYDGRIEKRRYWHPFFRPADLDLEESALQVRAALERAVRIQQRSDVPVGSYLSGGLDTATIVALAPSRGMPTFTCGYDATEAPADERQFDETDRAARIARALGTKHHAERIDATALPQLMERVAYHLEEPRVGISFQNYYICSKIAEHVKVVLSGSGGDELFGGYLWRYGRVLQADDDFDERYCREWQRLLPDHGRAAFFSDGFMQKIAGYRSRDSYDAVMGPEAPPDGLNRALYFDMRTFLASLLVVEDHLSMAHSLESRMPLLDEDLVEVMLRVPARHKVRLGSDGVDGKVVLKHAMRGVLPEEVIKAPKQGFIPPLGHWFRTNLGTYLHDTLDRPVTVDYFAPGMIRKCVEEHLSGRANHRVMLWSLLSFEMMHRLFVGR